jgi:hypothetical protein
MLVSRLHAPSRSAMLMITGQCIGLTVWGLKYGIFRGVRYPPISRPAHHNRKTGPLPWHSGPTRVFVIYPTCSITTTQYSILRFGRCLVFQRKGYRDEQRAAVIGPKVSGVALVYPDNQSVVSSKLDLRHALSSYKRADHHSTKLVSHRPWLTLRHSVDHWTDWEVSSVKIYQDTSSS